MSFVGPRPDVPGYADKLTGDDRDVLKLRPGITGPATLKYRLEDELLSNVRTLVQGSRFKVQGREAQCISYDNAVAYVNGVSEAIFKVGMCLPAGPYVTDDDVRYIVETIKANIVG